MQSNQCFFMQVRLQGSTAREFENVSLLNRAHIHTDRCMYTCNVGEKICVRWVGMILSVDIIYA